MLPRMIRRSQDRGVADEHPHRTAHAALTQRPGGPLAGLGIGTEQRIDERVVAPLGAAELREQRRRRRGGLLGRRQLRRADALVDQPHEAEHAVVAHRHRDPRAHAELRGVRQADGRLRERQPPSVEPVGDLGRRLAREDRREPDAVERPGVRRVGEHAVAPVLDRHGAPEPLSERVDEVLQLGHRRARYRCRIRSRRASHAAPSDAS